MTEKYVFCQHFTETIASSLPCSLIYKQTTIQGQIGPKLKKTQCDYLTAREVVYVYAYCRASITTLDVWQQSSLPPDCPGGLYVASTLKLTLRSDGATGGYGWEESGILNCAHTSRVTVLQQYSRNLFAYSEAVVVLQRNEVYSCVCKDSVPLAKPCL